ncbi:hypothetical protein MMC28_002625 [Mycoblastus sanguinarius]|nr:hypothetical protein [Mycoblastus sanguinarius]
MLRTDGRSSTPSKFGRNEPRIPNPNARSSRAGILSESAWTESSYQSPPLGSGSAAEPQAKRQSQQSIVNSMEKLSIRANQNIGSSSPFGRAQTSFNAPSNNSKWVGSPIHDPPAGSSFGIRHSQHVPGAGRIQSTYTPSPMAPKNSQYTPAVSRTPSMYKPGNKHPLVYPKPRMADVSETHIAAFLKEEFVPGTIIRALLHEEDFNQTSQTAFAEASRRLTTASGTSETTFVNTHISFTQAGKPIYTEYRYLIVVASFGDHYLAIPLYTHNGNGLNYKKDRNEYISFRDHRHLHDYPEGYKQSIHEPLVTDDLKAGVRRFKLESVAHVAYPVSRKYILPVAHQGNLNTTSTDRLLSIFRQHMAGETG